MSKHFLEHLYRKAKHIWSKNKKNKLILFGFGVILWPIVLLLVSMYLFKSFDNPFKKALAIGGFLLITAPISIGWFQGITESLTENSSVKKEVSKDTTATQGNCIGPDGKRMWLSVEKCKAFNDAWKNPQTYQPTSRPDTPPSNTNTDGNTAASTPAKAKLKDPYELFSKIGKEVAGENSSVSVFDNDDGTVDVVNNIVVQPEVEWGIDAYTRKWVTDFMKKTYTSGQPVRYSLVTIAFTGTGRKAVRVGIGASQAKFISQEEWKNTNPYDLCNWINRVSTGENQQDYANSTFAENYNCN